MKKINNIFVTGLLVTVPISITIYVFYLIGKWGDLIVSPLFNYLSKYGIPRVPGVGIIIILFLIFLVGLFAKNVIGNHIINFFDRIVNRIPIVKNIYGSLKDISNAFLGKTQNKVFKDVVLVNFPHKDSQSLAFLTNKSTFLDNQEEDWISVFIPTTPNPTSGYFIMYKKEDVKKVDISVEEALRIIISAGAVEKSEKHLDKKEIK